MQDFGYFQKYDENAIYILNKNLHHPEYKSIFTKHISISRDSSTSDDNFECEESFYEGESSSDGVVVIKKVNDISEKIKDENDDNEMVDISSSDDEDNCPIYN